MFWRRKVKTEFTSAVGQRAYEITHEGFAEFQKDMFDIKAFEYEAMQQEVDSSLKEQMVLLLDKNQFLEKRLQALKFLDERYLIVRNP